MNKFGGDWTKEKIEIFMKYVPAYLNILNNKIQGESYAKNWKLLYFDGFAGSGAILKDGNEYDFLKGVAMQVLEIDYPRTFDIYYFVELNQENANRLQEKIEEKYSADDRKVYIVQEDFNKKIKDLANFLNKNKHYKSLIFVDPYGMSVEWESLKTLKDLSVDMWILVPTGIGVGRLLKNDGTIPNSWLEKLSIFLGLSQEEIKEYFYKNEEEHTLFGTISNVKKEDSVIEKAGELYQKQLKKIFKYVSKPYPLKNSKNSIMYHFIFASKVPVATKIADKWSGNVE